MVKTNKPHPALIEICKEVCKKDPDQGKIHEIAGDAAAEETNQILIAIEAGQFCDAALHSHHLTEILAGAYKAIHTFGLDCDLIAQDIKSKLKGENRADKKTLRELIWLLESKDVKAAYKFYRHMDTFVRDLIPSPMAYWMEHQSSGPQGRQNVALQIVMFAGMSES